MQLGDLILDTDRFRAVIDGRPVALSPIEFRLLHALFEAQGKVVLRSRLMESAWGDQRWPDEVNALSMAMYRLRRKIGARYLHVTRGFGYRLALD